MFDRSSARRYRERMDLRDTILECDELLKKGMAFKVKELLKTISFSAINREDRLPLATICRRASLFEEGLRVLTPVIKGADRRHEPSGDEMVEYAVLLLKNGSHSEALTRLAALDSRKTPLVHMYRGFAHMARWEYGEAKAHLELQLGCPMDMYMEQVCHVNLAACLVALGADEPAVGLLNRLIGEFKRRNLLRLLSNCLELRSQIHIANRRWRDAENDLQMSCSILKDEKTVDQILVKKWMAVLEARRSGDARILEEFRKEVVARRHFESVRDIDWNILKIRFDERLFDYLLFGTPFPFFRERMIKAFPAAAIKEEMLLGAEETFSLHLATGLLRGCAVDELAGRSLNLIFVLMRDFYRAKQVGELFVHLYEGEKFDVFTSINRVHQTVRYVRKQIDELRLPFVIEDAEDGYRLNTAGEFAFVVPLDRDRLPDAYWERLKRRFGKQDFTAVEAIEFLKISQSKFQRWCAQAVAARRVESMFRGAATRYRISEEKLCHASGGS